MAEYKKLYQTSAVNTGGRSGIAYLTDGSFEVTVRSPKELGGKGDGVNPEQLFALGYASCFNGALEVALQEAGLKAKAIVSLAVGLSKAEGSDFRLDAEIEVGIEGVDLDQAQAIAERAHEICPYSKATKGNIPVTVKAVAYDASKAK